MLACWLYLNSYFWKENRGSAVVYLFTTRKLLKRSSASKCPVHKDFVYNPCSGETVRWTKTRKERIIFSSGLLWGMVFWEFLLHFYLKLTLKFLLICFLGNGLILFGQIYPSDFSKHIYIYSPIFPFKISPGWMLFLFFFQIYYLGSLKFVDIFVFDCFL